MGRGSFHVAVPCGIVLRECVPKAVDLGYQLRRGVLPSDEEHGPLHHLDHDTEGLVLPPGEAQEVSEAAAASYDIYRALSADLGRCLEAGNNGRLHRVFRVPRGILVPEVFPIVFC